MPLLQDGTIEDYYGHGRHAHKLIVDLQESAAMRAFLEGLRELPGWLTTSKP